jgi:hypothetical protein
MVTSRAPGALHGVEGVGAVDHVDVVAATGQGPGLALDVGGVAAEAVGAEERGDEAEPHGDLPVATARGEVRIDRDHG